MKVARAERQDLDAAMMLMGLLDNIDRGYYPSDSDDNEDDPTFFDEDDPEHLAQLWRRLKACLDAAPGFQGRVIFGAATLMDPRNEVIDPEDDAISLHPRLEAALQDAKRLDWLADPENTIGNVQLPTEAVTANLHSLRDAIDAAMAMPANAEITGRTLAQNEADAA
ncbi:MAG: hypothetical protein NDI84_02810 [Steroidobacteraceae bacterium]|nr:hypothetical protein [Steroidobacteraceae bacterium]